MQVISQDCQEGSLEASVGEGLLRGIVVVGRATHNGVGGVVTIIPY